MEDETDLTDDENDEKNDNFYNFIRTEINSNQRLKDYLFEVGFNEKEDFDGLDEEIIQHMYSLLSPPKQAEMKKFYLENIRKICGNPEFNFIGGKRRSKKGSKRSKKSYKKSKKSYKKSKKVNRSKKRRL